MSQKIAFITGANRGIGLATARELARLGITVVLGSRDLASGQAAVDQLQAEGLDAHLLHFDVTNPAHHTAARDFLTHHWGHLDILVNNAGIAPGDGTFSTSGPIHRASEIPLDELRRVMETNFFAQVALTQTLLPLLRLAPAARIVNLSSILGSQTLHATPSSVIYNSKSFSYDVSKTALNSLTIHLAHELRDTPIKVNSAHPGWVKTDMGGPHATMDLADGAKTSVQLATLPEDGPTGGYFHLGKPIPW